jgi:hypothetical protein
MKKQKRYQHRVSWIENGELKTEWFTNHKKAFELFDNRFLRGVPVYYARKISDALTAHQFDHIRSENEFGKELVKVANVPAVLSDGRKE